MAREVINAACGCIYSLTTGDTPASRLIKQIETTTRCARHTLACDPTVEPYDYGNSILLECRVHSWRIEITGAETSTASVIARAVADHHREVRRG